MDNQPRFQIGTRVRHKSLNRHGVIEQLPADRPVAFIKWDGTDAVSKHPVNISRLAVPRSEQNKLSFPKWCNSLSFSEEQKREFLSSEYISATYTGPSDAADQLLYKLGLTSEQRAAELSKVGIALNYANPSRLGDRYAH
jgi:hypothetical protein